MKTIKTLQQIADELTQEARALAPEHGDAVEVRAFGTTLALWHGDAAWGLPTDEPAARASMTKIIQQNPQF